MSGATTGRIPGDCLDTGLQQLGLSLTRSQRQSCLAYLELLGEWNRAYNLTAIREPDAMVAYHLLDSLAVLPHVKGNRCLDVGTGAGLPGLILAIADPGRQWLLIDGNRKRVRFVNQVILELQLANAKVIQQRVEDLAGDIPYSTITTRAYGRLSKIWRDSRHLLGNESCLLAMKGANIRAELAEMQSLPVTVEVHDLAIPALAGQRTVVEIRKTEQPR